MSGFSLSNATTPNVLILTRTPTNELPGIDARYQMIDIVNPSTPRETVYVRISIFDDENAAGNRVDSGSVVFVLQDLFSVTAYVPPYLTFCSGITVAVDCSSASGSLAEFGEFSAATPTAVTTQFAGATNSSNGYNVFVQGFTMTSGSNIIDPLTQPTPSQPGVSQYGINLRSNSNPAVGSNASGVGTANISADYNLSLIHI